MFARFCKLCFIALLFIIFLKYFGFPSLGLYLKKGVMTTTTTEEAADDKVEAPAITICPQNKESNFGWKNSLGSRRLHNGMSFLGIFCSGLEGSELVSCINNNTYSIVESQIDINSSTTYVGQKNISTEISFTPAGKSFTWNGNLKLGRCQNILLGVDSTPNGSGYIQN